MKKTIQIMFIVFVFVVVGCIINIVYNVISFNTNTKKINSIVERNYIKIESIDSVDSTYKQYTIIDIDNKKCYRVEEDNVSSTVNPIAKLFNKLKYTVSEIKDSDIVELVNFINTYEDNKESGIVTLLRCEVTYNGKKLTVSSNDEVIAKYIQSK